MNAVVVTGISMRPYLLSGDVLLVQPIERPLSFGSLVLARTIHGEQIVHRYLGRGKVKGDKVKYWDDITSIDYLVLARLENQRQFDLHRRPINLALAILSYFNQKRFIIIHKVSSLMISLLGQWGRHGK
jgi:signal peptidase I